MDNKNNCGVYRFTMADRVIGNLALYAGAAIGAYAMGLDSLWLALGYLAYVVVGLTLVVRFTICPRCPHLLENNECLFVPPALAAMMVSKTRTGALSLGETLLTFAVFGGMALIPVYWVLGHPWLLGAFVVAQIFLVLTFHCNLCRKCENRICPLNKCRRTA